MSHSRFIISALFTACALGCGANANGPAPTVKPERPVKQAATDAIRRQIEARLPSTPTAARRTTAPAIKLGVQSGRVPALGSHGPQFLTSGSFPVPSNTAPGTASYDQAPSFDPNSNAPPAAFGTGAYAITVDGTSYASTTAESISGVFTDEQGTDYLVLSDFTEAPDPNGGPDLGTVVHTVVLASDFAPGATVALDGNDRLVFFGSGPIDQPEPALVAMAISGSVTFTAGTTLADPISATVSGDFGLVSLSPLPPPPPPPPPPVGALVAGPYNLNYDATPQVSCDGALAGHESDFAAINLAALNLVNGAVNLSQSSSTAWAIDGTPISTGFGATPLLLDTFPGDPSGIIGGESQPQSQSGPAGTTLAAVFLALDSVNASANRVDGFAGAGYTDAAQTGSCTVGFEATLTP